MDIPLTVKFSGMDADLHRLPAFDAAESIDGIAKSLLVPVNYLIERKVRHKNFQFEGFRIDLVALRPGSFDAIFQIVIDPNHLHYLVDAGIAVAAPLITDFLKTIFRRAIGHAAPARIEELEREGRISPGDVAAIIDAVEPSVRRSHTVINKGANNINIITGDNSVVLFDAQSKRYVQGNFRNNELRSKLVSVGSYNANTQYGRVFDFEAGKTLPFNLAGGVDAKSVGVLLDSITRYALARANRDAVASAVAIQYTSIDSVDGRIKRFIIHKARKDIHELML